MALGRNHRIFNIGNSSGSYGISRVYHDSTLSGDGTLSSLLGVVDAGDTEVNEFVYNNSGDIINVDNVVQSNSGEWGNGGESYSALTSNSANWNEVSSKLDASAFDPNEFYPMTGNPSGFLTAHQDITNKLDVSAFSDVSGTFLTAVPAGYATTGEVNSVSSILSAAIESNSGIVYTGIDPIVVNNDDKAISANTWAFSAGDGISFVDDNVNKITRIDVTAQGGNPEVESYVINNSATIDDVNTTYQTNSGSYLTSISIPESANWNDATTAYQTNSASYLTAHQDLSDYVPVSSYNELKASYDSLSSLFATYSGQWLLPNTGV